MRYAHQVRKVRAAEQALMAQLPPGALMQRAAAGLASVSAGLVGRVPGSRVVVLAGSGDNGGDALFAGARLASRGAAVLAVTAGSRVHEQGAAALRAAGGRLASADDDGVSGGHRRGRPDPRRPAGHRRPGRAAGAASLAGRAGRALPGRGGRGGPAEWGGRGYWRGRGIRDPGRRDRDVRHPETRPADRPGRRARRGGRTDRHRPRPVPGFSGRQRPAGPGRGCAAASARRGFRQVPPGRGRDRGGQ